MWMEVRVKSEPADGRLLVPCFALFHDLRAPRVVRGALFFLGGIAPPLAWCEDPATASVKPLGRYALLPSVGLWRWSDC
jgi:hypothetical protein